MVNVELACLISSICQANDKISVAKELHFEVLKPNGFHQENTSIQLVFHELQPH